MKIQINAQHLRLSPHQEEAIEHKIEHLAKLDCHLEDESTQIRVDLIYEASRKGPRPYECHATFFVPHGTIRAEAQADTLENAVDDVVDKLRGQIERYKAKMHHLEKRKE